MNQPKIDRLQKPEFGGGALLDLGVYGLHIFDMVYQSLAANVLPYQNIGLSGVDDESHVVVSFPDGATGYLFTSINLTTDNCAVIYGMNGRICINNSYDIKSIEVYQGNKCIIRKRDHIFSQYAYEIKSCMQSLNKHQLSCGEISHESTLRVLGLVEEIMN